MTSLQSFPQSGSKYLRRIICDVEGFVDVYAILDAFDVGCPATGHAIKKLLFPGCRGGKDRLQDLTEARDAIDRAIQMHKSHEEFDKE
jgi:hypothetical protein